MLSSPEAHEPLADEPWSETSVRAAIAAIVVDAEGAFDDGWRTHPEDVVEPADATTRFRNTYFGGAGVVDALQRLEQLARGRLEHGRGRHTLWTGDLVTAPPLAGRA